MNARTSSDDGAGGLVVVFALGLLGWWKIIFPMIEKAAARAVEEERERQFLEARPVLAKATASIIEQHLDALARQRRQLVRVDPYGNLLDDKWQEEISYFISSVLEPGLLRAIPSGFSQEGWPMFVGRHVYTDDIRKQIDRCAADAQSQRDQAVAWNSDGTPEEFEHFCADTLRRTGWSVQVTKGSGEQGVDVLASKDGVIVVLQCKRWRRPVGNKAVQEAHAGMVHYSANAAAVIATSSFTRSAHELAQSTGVHLLHYTDLPNLDRIVA